VRIHVTGTLGSDAAPTRVLQISPSIDGVSTAQAVHYLISREVDVPGDREQLLSARGALCTASAASFALLRHPTRSAGRSLPRDCRHACCTFHRTAATGRGDIKSDSLKRGTCPKNPRFDTLL
jgi:hypothetical protein